MVSQEKVEEAQALLLEALGERSDLVTRVQLLTADLAHQRQRAVKAESINESAVTLASLVLEFCCNTEPGKHETHTLIVAAKRVQHLADPQPVAVAPVKAASPTRKKAATPSMPTDRDGGQLVEATAS